MEERRKFCRVPVQGIGKFNRNNHPHWNGLFITNFSRYGIGFGVPYQYDIRNGDDLTLEITITSFKKSLTIMGRTIWIKALNCYHDYAIVGGVEFKDINSEEKRELLDYVYNKVNEKLPKISNQPDSSIQKTRLPHEQTIDTEIMKALKGFSIVEGVIKTSDTLVIKVNNEQWSNLSKSQQNILAKTFHRFIDDNIQIQDIYVKGKEGEKLAWLQREEPGNKYMFVAH